MSLTALIVSAVVMAAPQQAQVPPKFDGLGGLHMEVSTDNELAQTYFDQGLAFQFGFNLDEARKAFQFAARIDPDCAMHWWGVAMANGPHLNATNVPPDNAKAAWEAIQKARSANANQRERAMIEALAKRFSSDPNADRGPLDKAYAEAMQSLSARYYEDAHLAALYAESEMILHPWDLHEPGGKPKPWTEEIIQHVQRAVSLDDEHPLALHLLIHAVEGSHTPELAEAAADKLLTMQPDLGHMVHMPSHIYVRVGRWDDAIRSNAMAVEADTRYMERSPGQGFYVFYASHNYSMQMYAAMMSGRLQDAKKAFKGSMDMVPQEMVMAMPSFADGFMGAEYEVMLRFGLWDEVLAMPVPHEDFPVDTTLRHFARAVAWAAKGEAKKARMEQSLFYQKKDAVPENWGMYFSGTPAVLLVAEHMMNGEILLGEGKIERCIATLKKAVAAEDQLKYTEPPDWLLPPRHALGAVLVEHGRFAEAEAVYREDLKRVRNNGWSLFGLAQALHGQNKHEEAARTDARFAQVWAKADVQIESSCKCVK